MLEDLAKLKQQDWCGIKLSLFPMTGQACPNIKVFFPFSALFLFYIYFSYSVLAFIFLFFNFNKNIIKKANIKSLGKQNFFTFARSDGDQERTLNHEKNESKSNEIFVQLQCLL